MPSSPVLNNVLLPIIRHQRLFVILLGIVLVIPGLFSGLFADDYWFFLWLSQPDSTPNTAPYSFYQLFSFHDGSERSHRFLLDSGIMPWWSGKDNIINFWRPLAELTHIIDFRLLGFKPFLMHLHSLAWYAVLLGLAYRFYTRLLGNNALATLALLVFATDAIHGFTITWIANRNAIMAATFALLCFNSHDDYVRSGNAGYRLLAIVSLLAALLSAEAGMTTLALLFGYAVFLDERRFYQRFSSLIPYGLVFLLWLLVYKQLGYGAGGGGNFYVDPINNPAMFFERWIDRLPRIFILQLTFVASFVREYVAVQTILRPLGLAIMAIFLFITLWSRNRHLGFAFLTATLATIPIAGGIFHERNLLFVSIVLSPVVAQLIHFLWHVSKPKVNVLAKTASVIIIIMHIVIAGIAMPFASYLPNIVNQPIVASATSLPPDIANKHVILLDASLFNATFYIPVRHYYDLPVAKSFWNILSEGRTSTLKKTGTHTYVLTSQEGLIHPSDLLIRNVITDPFVAGQTVHLSGLDITTNTLNAQGIPTQLTLQLLDDDPDSYRIAQWTKKGFIVLTPRLGEEIAIHR